MENKNKISHNKYLEALDNIKIEITNPIKTKEN